MKTINIFVLLILTVISIGCYEEKKPLLIKKKHKSWCENVCMERVFKNFHESGESWGTSSSSLTGMRQGDTFDKVVNHCSKIYAPGCYEVRHNHPSAIHYDGPHYASPEK